MVTCVIFYIIKNSRVPGSGRGAGPGQLYILPVEAEFGRVSPPMVRSPRGPDERREIRGFRGWCGAACSAGADPPIQPGGSSRSPAIGPVSGYSAVGFSRVAGLILFLLLSRRDCPACVARLARQRAGRHPSPAPFRCTAGDGGPRASRFSGDTAALVARYSPCAFAGAGPAGVPWFRRSVRRDRWRRGSAAGAGRRR